MVFFLRCRRPPRSTRTCTRFPYTSRFRSRIALIECDDDPLIDPSMHDDMAARYGDSTRHRISGGEHYPAALKPDRYNAILRDFHATLAAVETARSEERRVGKEWVSTCRSRCAPSH